MIYIPPQCRTISVYGISFGMSLSNEIPPRPSVCISAYSYAYSLQNTFYRAYIDFDDCYYIYILRLASRNTHIVCPYTAHKHTHTQSLQNDVDDFLSKRLVCAIVYSRGRRCCLRVAAVAYDALQSPPPFRVAFRYVLPPYHYHHHCAAFEATTTADINIRDVQPSAMRDKRNSKPKYKSRWM